MASPSGPFWVAKPARKFGGVDFLGLRQPGLDMANRLLPGITNFTRQVRYYTVIAWMYVRAEEGAKLRLLESAFVHAVRTHEHTGPLPLSGMVGRDRVPFGSDEDSLLPLQSTGERIVSVMDAPFFGPSAKMLGVAGQLGERSAFEPLARELAETVDLDPAALAEITDAGLPRELLEPLSSLCLCESARGRERDLLEEFLFRHERRRHHPLHDEERELDGPRRRTLALLLDALEPTEDPLRFLVGRFLDTTLRGHGYEAPQALKEEAFGAGLMSLRWCFRYALETAWLAFGRLIGRHSFGTTGLGPVADWVLKGAGCGEPWCPEPELTLSELLRKVGSSPGVELEGVETAANLLSEGDLASASLAAAAVLAVLGARAQQASGADSCFSDFMNLGHPWWVPMSELASRLDGETTVREWLCLILDRYVVGQHLMTGARKWADGKDGFFFHPSETGYTPSGSVDIDTWEPDPGPTKIPAALSLLRGIQLVEVAETDEGDLWQTTALGRDAIERVLANPGAR